MEGGQDTLSILTGSIEMLTDVAELLQFFTELTPSGVGLARCRGKGMREGLIGQVGWCEAGVRMCLYIPIKSLLD